MKSLTKTFGFGVAVLMVATLTCALASAARAQSLSGDALIDALRGGGYVLVMRHANAAVPERRGPGFGGGGGRGGGGDGDPEPELTQMGLGLVTGMRYAFRELGIPVGDTLTSPTLRTRQHAQHFGFGDLQIVEELGNDSMESDSARSAWLAAKAAESPRPGTNTVIVTHGPNITGAFGLASVAEGETIVIKPGPTPTVVGRVPIEEWSKMAVR